MEIRVFTSGQLGDELCGDLLELGSGNCEDLLQVLDFGEETLWEIRHGS